MAVDYSIITRVPNIGSRLLASQAARREENVRNQLLARQNLQFEQAQEDRRRALQREQQVQGLYRQAADVLRQYGKNPDDPQVLQEGVAKATEAGNMQMAQIFTGMLADAQKRQQERAYRAEYEQKYGGGAAAGTPAAAAPAGMPPASPKITSTLIDQGARQPDVAPPAITAAQSFPVAPLAGTPTETPMAPTTNALAAAPAARGANALAAPADPFAAQRAEAMKKAMSRNPYIAAEGKLQLENIPKLQMPKTGAGQPLPSELQIMDALNIPRTEENYRKFKSYGMREPAEQAPILTEVQDPQNPQRMLKVDTRVYRPGGSIGSPGVIGTTGKSPAAAATAAKTEQGQQQARDIIDTLRASYDNLDRMRAVPSTQRSAISNALSYIASTGVGQIAGRVAGTEEQVERDVISSARNQILNAVKNATGMSAQQLNSNVEFTSWLRSLTDPTVSYEANQRILDNLEKFIASGGKYSERKQSGSVSRATSEQAAAERPAPKGVDPEDWKFMTSEERKLWK